MSTAQPTTVESIRSRLGHPVIDADGHFLEFQPALAGYLEEEGVPAQSLFEGEIALVIGRTLRNRSSASSSPTPRL